jgi:cystathionine gamma-synthase
LPLPLAWEGDGPSFALAFPLAYAARRMTRRPSPGTLAVHGGEPRTHAYDALAAPIVQTATYSFENTAALRDFMEGKREREEYGRYGNPTVRLAEEKLAALENAEDAIGFASGMAAVTTSILALGKAGAHVVLFNDCYRRTRQFVTQTLARFGVEHTLVPPADLTALENALTPNTRLVVSEAPTNPFQTVVDLEKLASICRARRIKTLVDTTFATPVNLRALDLGIDLVVHSSTKYLGGHNDVLGGFVSGSETLISLVRDLRDVLGGVLDPHAAYLTLRGMKTLALRVARQNESALEIARFLEAHPKIRTVFYPGLPSHPSHAVASRLMSGFGGVVTFRVASDLEGTSRFVDACAIPRIAPSLGGVESLIEQPALMSYYEIDRAAREALGMHDDLVRFAVGIEDRADLIDDLERALAAIG